MTSSPNAYKSRCPAPPAPVCPERVKKSPKNRIYVTGQHCGGTRDQSAYDKFASQDALPAGRCGPYRVAGQPQASARRWRKVAVPGPPRCRAT
jgi:hypothetical protein